MSPRIAVRDVDGDDGEGAAARAGPFGVVAAAAVAAATLRRPAALAALGLLLTNDHLLKGRWPGPLTGKLSDLAWPLVAVPVVGLLLAPAGGRLGRRRWALVATLAPALPFVAVNLFPAAADATASLLSAVVGSSVVTVDPTDLVALPAFLLPLRWLRQLPIPAPRPPGTVSAVQLSILGLAALGTAATSCYDDRPRVQRLGLDGDGHLIAWVSSDGSPGSVARSLDAGETWHEIADVPGADEPAGPSADEVDRLFGEQSRSEACGPDACYRPLRDAVERRSGDRTETLSLSDPRRDIPRRRQLGSHVCASGDLPRSTDVEVVTAPSGGERAVIGRGLEGVVVVDGDTVHPVAVLGAAPPDRGSVTLAVIEPELAVTSVIRGRRLARRVRDVVG